MVVAINTRFSSFVALDSHVASELVKQLKFADTDQSWYRGLQFNAIARICYSYLPKVVKEPK